jgi:hypothetical protein
MDDAATLYDYIREMNKSSDEGFGLSEDLDHWAGLGIHTQDQLYEYLNDRQDGIRMWTTTNND